MSLDQKEMICKVAKEMGYDKIASFDDRLGYFWDGEGFVFDPMRMDDCLRIMQFFMISLSWEWPVGVVSASGHSLEFVSDLGEDGMDDKLAMNVLKLSAKIVDNKKHTM